MILRSALCACVLLGSTLVSHGADEFIQRANELAAPPSGATDVTATLFGACAAMDQPPVQFEGQREAGLLVPGARGWTEAAAWAEAPAQQAVLESVREIANPRENNVLALPYGEEGIDQAWISAGLYIELGPDDTLAGAQLHYLDVMENVLNLCAIEATRLAADGKGEDSADVMLASVFLGRMITEREFMKERSFGARSMMYSVEKLCDVIFTFPDAFDAALLTQINTRTEERRVKSGRIDIPKVNRVAAEQLIALTIEERGDVKPGKLATTMSAIKSQGRPLAQFSEAAFWRDTSAGHADWFDTNKQLDNLYGDWQQRWELADLKDPYLERLTDYRKMNKKDYLVLHETLAGIEEMFDLRMDVITSFNGARAAIACMAFKARNKVFPPKLPAVQPKFIKTLGVDPYSIKPRYRNMAQNRSAFKRFEKNMNFEYFVPIRDQEWDAREEKVPYQIEVVLRADHAGTDESEEMFLTESEIEEIDIWMTGGDQYELVNPPSREDIKQMYESGQQLSQFIDFGSFDLRRLSQPEVDALLAEMEKLTARYSMTPFPSVCAEIAGMGNAGEPGEPKPLAQILIKLVLNEQMYRSLADYETWTDVPSSYRDAVIAGLNDMARTELGRGGPSGSITRDLDDSTFVLYSVGVDEQDDEARKVVPVWLEPKPPTFDILIWPPVLSLERGAFAN